MQVVLYNSLKLVVVVVVVAAVARARKDGISDKEWSVRCVSMICEYLAVFSVNEAAPLF